MMKRIANTLIAWAQSVQPTEIIGGHERPYLLRWEWFKSWLLSIYVHRFMRSDDDRAEHDHPAPYASYIADGGGYFEHRKGVRRWIVAGQWVVRLNPWAPHRVELPRFGGHEMPTWTIFVRGPNIRFSRWGFHCKSGWVHWKKFVKAGCGE
jgi:hypothetical protein